jgi:Ni/Fe-hydrogenase 1 B-type cytochrome subunit
MNQPQVTPSLAVPLATSGAARDLTHIDEAELAQAASIRSVYVYEAPVRLWHWVNAAAFMVLAITGYLIGSPLPSTGGEASYIRFAHFSAGYVLAIGLVGRTYWALVGNYYAKELYWVPLFQLAYWQDVWGMFKWYAFLSPRPGQYIGHNPLARFAMYAQGQ